MSVLFRALSQEICVAFSISLDSSENFSALERIEWLLAHSCAYEKAPLSETLKMWKYPICKKLVLTQRASLRQTTASIFAPEVLASKLLASVLETLLLELLHLPPSVSLNGEEL